MQYKYIFVIACFLLLASMLDKYKNYKNVQEIPEIEMESQFDISDSHHEFTNLIANNKVSVIHSLEFHGFHFYSCVNFKNKDIGVLAGGTGLRLRIAKNGGESWTQIRFSPLSNTFYDLAFSKNTPFAVGESKSLFSSPDFGESWHVFDTEDLFERTNLLLFKYYKTKFINSNIRFIGGQRDRLILTNNGGETWDKISLLHHATDCYLADILFSDNNTLF